MPFTSNCDQSCEGAYIKPRPRLLLKFLVECFLICDEEAYIKPTRPCLLLKFLVECFLICDEGAYIKPRPCLMLKLLASTLLELEWRGVYKTKTLPSLLKLLMTTILIKRRRRRFPLEILATIMIIITITTTICTVLGVVAPFFTVSTWDTSHLIVRLIVFKGTSKKIVRLVPERIT